MSEEKMEIIIPEGTEMISLPAKPLNPRPKAHTDMAKTIANRYLSVPVLEKMISQKKANKKKKEAEKFKPPTTPEEFYDRGQKYLHGAQCAVPFLEQSKYYMRASEMFTGAGDYLDAAELAEKYYNLAEKVQCEGYEEAYNHAVLLRGKASTADDWFHAARAFERIPGYMDADEQADYCEHKLSRLNSFKGPKVAVILVLIAALLFGGVQYCKTDAFKLNVAKAAYSIGMDSLATTFLKEMKDQEGIDSLLVESRYENAKKHMKSGRYTNAVGSLKACGDYQDAPELLRECGYYAGVAAVQGGQYEEAQKYLLLADGFEDADTYLLEADRKLLEDAEIGDEVRFGGCECIVLDSADGKRLLLSSKLYGKSEDLSYHDSRTAVDWKDCSMRSTLNSAYLDEHFAQSEQAVILETELETGVSDKVFLLSKAEFLQYADVMGEKDALWWLRDSGEQPDTAMFVSDDGIVMEAGYPVDSTAIQARPAFWVRIQ